MTIQPSAKEMQLAKEQIDELKCEFAKRRNVSFALSAAFCVLAIILLIIKLPMMAFCGLLISFILLLRGLDASGHLQVIGLRSTKTLYPRMWIFEQRPPATPPTEQSTKP